MALKTPAKGTDDADLDVTPFMNLMIVLVPVLLLSMSFTQVTVLELRLPELTGGAIAAVDSQSKLEVAVDEKGIRVYFPENKLLKELPVDENEAGEKIYDYETLSLVLQAIKDEHQEKKDVVIRLDKKTDYQNIVKTMDTVKSFQTVHISSVVDVELFPEISLGDARP